MEPEQRAALAVAEEHPKTKISKLIKSVEADKSQKNVVLLLIELAENSEVSSNISISLRYYLDIFGNSLEETSFSEAGLLLLNSAIIYARRVDSLHLAVERLILSLANSEDTDKTKNNHDIYSTSTVSKSIRKERKRPSEQIIGPYEATMSPKRLKTVSKSKRFDDIDLKKKNINSVLENQMTHSVMCLSKNFTNPSNWQHSAIEDFDYDDEIDSKKNYKLFTHHLEHRYNTLRPDINFEMYFKIKDFIDAEGTNASLPDLWPPMSDAYIEHYVQLEDTILRNEKSCPMFQYDMAKKRSAEGTSVGIGSGLDESLEKHKSQEMSIASCSNPEQMEADNLSIDHAAQNADVRRQTSENVPCEYQNHCSSDETLDQPMPCAASDLANDSVPGIDMNTSNSESPDLDISDATSLSVSHANNTSNTLGESHCTESESTGLDISSPASISASFGNDTSNMLDESQRSTEITTELDNHTEQSGEGFQTDDDMDSLNLKTSTEDLTTVKVILPHLDDEGVFFSDLDEQDQKMLSPAVVATDVFRCVHDKSDLVVIVDEVIKRIYNIEEPREVMSLPIRSSIEYLPLSLNILKINGNVFKRQRTFKLGPEYELLKKQRCKKYVREGDRKCTNLCEPLSGATFLPPMSPCSEPDFLGFPEEGFCDKNRTMSRDSGISLQQNEVASEKGANENHLDWEQMTCKSSASSHGGERLFEPDSILDSQTIIESIEDQKTLQPEDINIPSTNNTNCDEISSDENRESSSLPKESLSDPASEISIEVEPNQNFAGVLSKVQEWHTHLQPILAQSGGRHHFDVFDLGTEIMSHFEEFNMEKNIIALSHVMAKKESSLISRYFLSALLLVNQGNLAIAVSNKNLELPSRLSDINLRLLSKKRNVISFEDDIGQGTSAPVVLSRAAQRPTFTNVRTLERIPLSSKADDQDSGISISDTVSI